MVEFGNSLDPDKEFDVLHGILDIPMEILEGDDEDGGDLDVDIGQCLGPIPSNFLMELSSTFNEEFDSAPIAGAHEQMKSDRVQESGSFLTQSPVSVLKSSSSCSREKNLSTISDNAIPLPPRKRSKPARYLGISPELSTSKQTSNSRRSKESRKRLPVATDLMGSSVDNVDNSLNVSDPAHQTCSRPHPPFVKKCAHCQSSETPQWRDGPLGQRTLCNACGVRYRSGCLFPEYRPKASPTFVPSQHSNSHKKVAEMRNKARLLNVDMKIGEAPEQRKVDRVQESGSFHPQTHVLVLKSSSGSCSNEKNLSIISREKNVAIISDNGIPLPPRKRSKPARYSGISPEPSTSKQTSNSKRSEESRKRLLVATNLMGNSIENVDNSFNISDSAHQTTSKPPLAKKCAHCQSSKTPEWREGPLGPRTLCNACGVRYRSGRLFPEYRPKASPTFVASQHSNSRKKVAEMRNDSNVLNIETMGAPLSPKKEAKIEEPSIVPWIEAKILELPTPQMIDGAPGQRQLPLHTDTTSSLVPPPTDGATEEKKIEGMQLAKHVETSTHVSLLERSRFYLKYRTKYFKHAGSDCASALSGSIACPAAACKNCAHCKTTKTPEWRRRQLEPQTICNASEQQYRAGLLVPEYRPQASPTFVLSRPFNSKRKMVQMKTKAIQSSSDISKSKDCARSESTTTPGWLNEPLDQHTLCNACGKRYGAGLLVQENRPHQKFIKKKCCAHCQSTQTSSGWRRGNSIELDASSRSTGPTVVPGKPSNLHTRLV